jgi:hypothetical protein
VDSEGVKSKEVELEGVESQRDRSTIRLTKVTIYLDPLLAINIIFESKHHLSHTIL